MSIVREDFDKISCTFRMMAFERAKGELHSIISARWETDDDAYRKSVRYKQLVNKFIKTVEKEDLL